MFIHNKFFYYYNRLLRLFNFRLTLILVFGVFDAHIILLIQVTTEKVHYTLQNLWNNSVTLETRTEGQLSSAGLMEKLIKNKSYDTD